MAAREAAQPELDRPLGIIVNPLSGRDVRRLYAQASTSTHDMKRGEVKRAVIGAAAAGVRRVLLTRDLFRISVNAVDTLGIDVEIEFLDHPFTSTARDTATAAKAMRARGCGALVVLGGDGTNRIVAQAWADAPLVPLSTGTNNVFPLRVEATCGGSAAGLVATGGVAASEVSRPAKVVRIEVEDEPDDLALIDAAFLVGDHIGSYLPFDGRLLRTLVLARAEAAAVGMSPIGGLLEPCGAEDEFGVEVVGGEGAHSLLAPVSPGLYQNVPIADSRRLDLGEPVEVVGPGLLAFDGDRERALVEGQRARLWVARDGPRVIDVQRALGLGASRGLFLDRHWHDHGSGPGTGMDCC